MPQNLHMEKSTSNSMATLLEGDITECRPIVEGYNATFLIKLSGSNETTCLGVYKPMLGETPLWDFPAKTLYKRESLAFRVSAALGWNIIPTTIVRDGPYGIGSVQEFIHAQPGRHYFNLIQEFRKDLLRFAVFDCLINNTDRKGGHILIDPNERLWGIDHGLAFLPHKKVRTVMWDLLGESIPDELKSDLRALLTDNPLLKTITSQLSEQEVAAFYGRAEDLANRANLPLNSYADTRRPFPWPTI